MLVLHKKGMERESVVQALIVFFSSFMNSPAYRTSEPRIFPLQATVNTRGDHYEAQGWRRAMRAQQRRKTVESNVRRMLEHAHTDTPTHPKEKQTYMQLYMTMWSSLHCSLCDLFTAPFLLVFPDQQMGESACITAFTSLFFLSPTLLHLPQQELIRDFRRSLRCPPFYSGVALVLRSFSPLSPSVYFIFTFFFS